MRVRQVVGKVTQELTPADLARRRAGARDLVVDLGSGDGKHVLAVARHRPDALVVGLDAGPDAMRRTAARAAARPEKGGTPNALFVWSAVEQWPAGLDGVTEVHCLMPWGSLLRALVTPDEGVLRAVASHCVPGAPFLITLNLHAWRPPVPEVGAAAEPTPDDPRLVDAYARAGWAVESTGYATAAEFAELGTSWTKRLGSTRAALAILMLRGRMGIGQDGN